MDVHCFKSKDNNDTIKWAKFLQKFNEFSFMLKKMSNKTGEYWIDCVYWILNTEFNLRK